MNKIICINDPSPDYKKWVFSNLGFETDSLPIYIGGIYTANNVIYKKKKCWGKKQEYIYISEMIEFGSIPKKYFAEYETYIDQLISSGVEPAIIYLYLN